MQQTAMVAYIVVLAASLLLSEKAAVVAFAPQRSLPNQAPGSATRSATALLAYATSNSNKQTKADNNSNNEKASFWLKDFSLASGEIIDPYCILKVSRNADNSLIRKSYIEQSRRYHPDGARHRKFLPGNCNSIEEVREQWERIKLAYEILKNPQMRKRYDRNEALSDPGRAVRRAATDAAVQSVVGLGKGLFDVGALAVSAIKNQASATAAAVLSKKRSDDLSDDIEKQQRVLHNHNNSMNNGGTNNAPAATTTVKTPSAPSSSQQLLP